MPRCSAPAGPGREAPPGTLCLQPFKTLSGDVEGCPVHGIREAAPGFLHGCEPDDADWDNMHAGNLWEDESDEESRESLGRFLQAVQDNVAGVDVEDLRRQWLADPTLSAVNNGAPLIAEAVRRCLAAGVDCYDSDTRTWVFSDCETCEGCADGETECLEATRRTMVKHTSGMSELDRVKALETFVEELLGADLLPEEMRAEANRLLGHEPDEDGEEE